MLEESQVSTTNIFMKQNKDWLLIKIYGGGVRRFESRMIFVTRLDILELNHVGFVFVTRTHFIDFVALEKQSSIYYLNV